MTTKSIMAAIQPISSDFVKAISANDHMKQTTRLLKYSNAEKLCSLIHFASLAVYLFFIIKNAKE